MSDEITLDAIVDEPHRWWHELRSLAPVSWVPAFGGWVITGREAAIEAMRDAETFTVDDPRFTTSQVLGRNMLSLDGEEHARQRQPFVAPYRPGAVSADWTGWLREESHRIIDGFIDGGEAELRTSFAGPLAVGTICRSLDLIGTDVSEILEWYAQLAEAIQDLSAGAVAHGGATAYAELRTAVERTVATSETSVLRAAVDAGLDADSIVANTAVLMFGAIETSEGATANALHQLLSDERLLRAVRSDRTLIRPFVEETMRLEPSVVQLDRYATCDTDFAGASIKQGDYVMISLAAANRDPLTFEDPDKLLVHRPNARQHVTFAQGPHACIGIHLARLETQIALDVLLERLPQLRLDPLRSTPPSGLVFRKPDRVTCTW